MPLCKSIRELAAAEVKEGAEEDVPRRSNDSKRAESRAGSERRMERWKEADSPLVRAPQVCEIGRRDSLARDLCAATRRPQPSSCRSTFGVPLVNLRQLPSRCDWLKLVSARLGLHDAQAKREYRQTSLSHRFHASSLSLSLSLSSSLNSRRIPCIARKFVGLFIVEITRIFISAFVLR